jgi:glutamine synthetase type III
MVIKNVYHTIEIKVPKEMAFLNDKGVLTIKQSLSKKGTITKAKGRPSIKILSDNNINEPEIIDKGDLLNVKEYKKIQKNKKKIISELQTKIKKTRKPKIKTDKNLIKEIERINKLNTKLKNPLKKIKIENEEIENENIIERNYKPLFKIKSSKRSSKSPFYKTILEK